MFSTTKHGHEKGKGNQPRMNTEQHPLRISRMARMGEGRGGAPMDTDGGLVVARRVEPGAFRSTRLAAPGYSGKTAEKREKQADFSENSGFQAELVTPRREIAIFHRNLSRGGAKRPENGLFGPFFACAARCGSFPIRKPSHAKTPRREGAPELPHAAWRSLRLCVKKIPGSEGPKANYDG